MNILHHRLDLLMHSFADKEILCTYHNKLLSLCKLLNFENLKVKKKKQI